VIVQTNLKGNQTIVIVGTGGLGVLGIQLANALGYRTIAIEDREIGLKLVGQVALKPDFMVNSDDPDVIFKN
jgi:D-arabinose 1-dehydrogenase-like Zn-dependent alcohol dehydrogenase